MGVHHPTSHRPRGIGFPGGRRPPGRRGIDVLAVLLALGGVALVAFGGSPPPEPSLAPAAVLGPPAPSRPLDGPLAQPSRGPGRSSPMSPGPAGTAGIGGRAGTPALARSVPVHLDIPAIGVSTPLMQLGLNPDGTIAVPPLRTDAPAGWYRNLASPGETGPAVILGHVDTARDGAAVFYRLRELNPGDQIGVRRQDGTLVIFTVSQVSQYEKATFPADAVYGPLDHPELRLITCGGSYDRIHRTYRGNVVVYATLTDVRP